MTTAVKVPWKVKEAAIQSLEHGGRVNPLVLIEAARDPEHPCHGDFTWNVAQASEERWRDQARALIRSCKFEVIVDDVTEPVVRYVSSGDEDADFVSFPKIRGKNQTRGILVTELAMLLGNASRVRGLALAKANIVGADIASRLESICRQVSALKEDLE